jgi:hypothetical protein
MNQPTNGSLLLAYVNDKLTVSGGELQRDNRTGEPAVWEILDIDKADTLSASAKFISTS